MAGLLWLAPVGMLGQGTPAQGTPAAQGPQWQNQAEFDLFTALNQDNNPKTKLDKLQQWEKQFPNTAFVQQRQQLFLTTYAALNQPKDAVDIAKKMLAANPKDFTALYYTMYYTQVLYTANQSPEILDQGEKAATTIAANLDTPPPNVTPEQWAKLRPDVELLAHVNLGFVAMQRKNWDAAEGEFQKSLQLSPNNGQVDYWMGIVIASEKNPAKQSAALFYFARAASYDGPGAMAAAGRQASLGFVQKQYKNYHGSEDGLKELLAAAKNQAAPAADFHIKSKSEIDSEVAKQQEEKDKQNPELALWKQLKTALTGADGASYFSSSMKDAQIPTLKGKVVSLQPPLKPKTVVMALEDGTTADATLKFDAALAGKVEPGTELSFEGVPESYTATPFMVVFNVDKEKLHGWTGKNATPPPPVRRKAGAGTRRTAKK